MLDAAELMNSGIVTIPMLSSFPIDDMGPHMITWIIDYAHTIPEGSIKIIKLVTQDQFYFESLKESIKELVKERV